MREQTRRTTAASSVFLAVFLPILCAFLLDETTSASVVGTNSDQAHNIKDKCPINVIKLDKASFHKENEENVLVVGFHPDDGTPGWSSTYSSLSSLAKFTNKTLADFNDNGKSKGVKVKVASLSKSVAPKLYTQYSVTRARFQSASNIFIFMFLPGTPDLPLKVQWNDGDASAFKLVGMISGIQFKLPSFQVALKERFTRAVTAGETLLPLIEDAKRIVEETADSSITDRANKYIIIMQRVEERGKVWLAMELNQINLSLKAGRCGSIKSCIKAWQTKNLILTFASDLIEDASNLLIKRHSDSIEKLHLEYGVPTPDQLFEMGTEELMKLSLNLESRESQLQQECEDEAEEVVDLMMDNVGIMPPVTRARLRQAHLLAEKGKLESIRGRAFAKYGKKVHKLVFIKELQIQIEAYYRRADLSERSSKATSKLALPDSNHGAML